MITLVCLSICLGAALPGGDTPRPAVNALCVTPDGKGFVSGSQKGVRVRAPAGDEETLPVRLDHVHALAYSPDGTALAAAGGSPAESGAVEIFSWPSRKQQRTLKGHEDVVYDVVWLNGGKALATASADRTVRIWDATTGKQLHKLSGHSGPVLCLAASADGKLLCSGSADQTIRVWDAASGKLLRSLNNHLGPVHRLAFRPGGDAQAPATLASAGGDATVRIWQPGIGRMVRIIRQPRATLTVAWAPDGTRLYAAGQEGSVRALDGDSDRVEWQREVIPGRVTALAVFPDGRLVVGGGQGETIFLPASPPR